MKTPRMLTYDEWSNESFITKAKHHGFKEMDFYMELYQNSDRKLYDPNNDWYSDYVEWYTSKYSKLAKALA